MLFIFIFFSTSIGSYRIYAVNQLFHRLNLMHNVAGFVSLYYYYYFFPSQSSLYNRYTPNTILHMRTFRLRVNEWLSTRNYLQSKKAHPIVKYRFTATIWHTLLNQHASRKIDKPSHIFHGVSTENMSISTVCESNAKKLLACDALSYEELPQHDVTIMHAQCHTANLAA